MATAKFKKGKDGYYSTNVWDGTYKDNGKKRYKHLRSPKSSKDLEKRVKEFERLRDERRGIIETDILFIEYAVQWRHLYKEFSRANNTNKMYENIINVHFIPIAYTKLQDIERKHFQLLLNHATGHPRTQQQIAMTFKQILRSAVRDRIFSAQTFADIFDDFEGIKYKAEEQRALTPDEQRAVFTADFKPMDKLYAYILYGCGLRRGEALALTESDFDLEAHTVSITKSHDISDNIPFVKTVKNITNGERILPIPNSVFDYISDYISMLRKDKRKYLFVNQNYKPMTKSGFRRMFDRILKAMQTVSPSIIEGLTSHVFRHNYCSCLCYQIPLISIKMVAKLVGDSEEVVMKVYNHIMMEKEDKVSAVNNALSFVDLEQKMEQPVEQKMEQLRDLLSWLFKNVSGTKMEHGTAMEQILP